MKVLVDTCVWSLALRSKGSDQDPHVRELRELVEEVRAQLIGPIRQELLSGIKETAQFRKLRDHLRAFPDLETIPEDFEKAAEFFNACRSKGIQGSTTDFLICAVAKRQSMPILTTDADFRLYARELKIEFHSPRQRH